MNIFNFLKSTCDRPQAFVYVRRPNCLFSIQIKFPILYLSPMKKKEIHVHKCTRDIIQIKCKPANIMYCFQESQELGYSAF